MTTSPALVPTPANAAFLAAENIGVPRASLVSGKNVLHLASVDAMSVVGTVESWFSVTINTSPPSISSSSHPNSSTWSANADAFFQWAFPGSEANFKGVFYVIDHYGETVPTTASTFSPVSKKQQLFSALLPGVWVFHVVTQDQQGYLTKQAGHYRVQIGADPGTGGILGRVTDAASANVVGATVTVNRGLYTQTTNSTGNYNFGTVPVGTWEVRVTKTPYAPTTQSVVVTANASTTQDFTVQ